MQVRRMRVVLASLLTTVVVLSGLVFMPSIPAQAVQAPENDDVFDVEAYNGAREDELEVLPLGDFFPAFDFNFTYSFDVDVSGGGLFGGAESDVETDLQSLLEPLFTPEEQYQKQSSRIDPPRANIALSTVGIQPGSQVSATAQPQGFRSQSGDQELFYAWALDTVSLSGVAAGADSLDLPSAGSPRGVHSRATQTDSDGDGMDDDWEVRYGLNPNDPGDAGQDPDQDGYTNDVYTNEDGETLIVEPATSAGEPGGSLTNLKEYIWGTDPTNPDTDGDGYSDGQDIAGIGQVQISFTVPPDAGINDASTLRLTVLGHSAQSFDQDTPLVKLDSNTLPLTVRDAEKLDVRLTATPTNPAPGEEVTLSAELGRTDFQPGILSYTWFVNSVPQQDGSGQSNYTFTYRVPETTTPGDVLVFSVTAVNFETQQQAEAELEVRVGELMQLHYDPVEVQSGKPLTITSTMVNESDPSELVFHWSLNNKELAEESGQGKTTLTLDVPKGVNEEHTVGLRVTTPDDSQLFADTATVVKVNVPTVTVTVAPATIALGETATAVAATEYFAGEELRYKWFLDDTPIAAEPNQASVEILPPTSGMHTVRVTAQSVGAGTESAEGSATVAVGVAANTNLSVLDQNDAQTGQEGVTLASVRQAIFGTPVRVGIFFGAFFVVLGIVTLLLIRRNALS